MNGEIYRKPIVFAIIATVVILVGTVVTMFYPMITQEMHPKLANLRPYSALQLAGKDIYPREGCNNCHTQTVRPLKTEVLRYGEYSKAGEFAYDRPFLWGSKRTGPDLARIGGKYPDAWHYIHHADPQSMFPKSNMPKYAFLKERKVDASATEAHMMANGFPYTPEDIVAIKDKTEMDALIAYLQVIGTAIKKQEVQRIAEKEKTRRLHEKNPLAGDLKAIERGKILFTDNCEACHGPKGAGGIGPSLADDVFFGVKGDLADDDYFEVINNGIVPGMVEEGRTAKDNMPSFKSLGKEKIWSIVAYIRTLQGK
jgi:cytochrome c oxidase cbb3-type subunit 2